MIVRVEHPYQVAHEGIAYRSNETADVPDEVAAHWIQSQWVEEVSDDASETGNRSRNAR